MILAATQIYGSHGGIPSYMRRLSEIFSALSLEQGLPFSAVSLIDSDWEPERHANPVRYAAFAGCGGHRPRFLRKLFELALKHPARTLVLGHVALAPVAQVLRYLGLVRSYVVVLHGIEAWQQLRIGERLACKSAGRVVTTTRFTKERFAKENGIAVSRISVVPLAIEKSSLEEISSTSSLGGPLRLLFVGRLSSLERYKGLDELLEAVSMLCREGRSIELQVVGTGDDLPRLVKKTRALGIEGPVSFSGSLDYCELAEAYKRCDLFALPSQGEGFGIAYLEAMSYGKPCLGARSGGAPEVIDHARDGYLVRYGDVAEIAARIRELNQNRNLLSAFGRRAQTKVREKYLFNNMLANWRELIREQACASETAGKKICVE
jgi:phosphatidylinositol alpha-1,6-mannosyltransferase